MIVAAIAPLLFVYLAQSPPPDPAPDPAAGYGQEQPVGGPLEEPYPADEPANGFADEASTDEAEPIESPEQTDRPADPVADEADEQTEEAEEEDEDLVCRRVHYIDDFGRQRSRKSCTPR